MFTILKMSLWNISPIFLVFHSNVENENEPSQNLPVTDLGQLNAIDLANLTSEFEEK